jgi:hypothetical protein
MSITVPIDDQVAPVHLHPTFKKKDYRYRNVKNRSLERGETNDCAVISMTLVTGEPYDKVHSLFAKCGRIFREGVWPKVANGVMHELGVKYYRYNKEEITEMGKKVGLTTVLFTNVHNILKEDTRYLMISRRHSAAIIDKKVVDWSEGTNRAVIGLVEIK